MDPNVACSNHVGYTIKYSCRLDPQATRYIALLSGVTTTKQSVVKIKRVLFIKTSMKNRRKQNKLMYI